MGFTVESSSVNNFFKIVGKKSINRCTSNGDDLCYGSNQFARLKELFETFREKHSNFDFCVPLDGYNRGMYTILTCRPTDNSEGLLNSFVTQNGKELGMSFQKEYIRDFEDNLEKNMAAGFEGIICESKWDKVMLCKGTGALSSYTLRVTEDSCTETVGSQKQSCDQKLGLFEPLLKSTPEIPKKADTNYSGGQPEPNTPQPVPSSTGWKKVVGAVGAIGFAYLAYKEAKAWQKEAGKIHPRGNESHQKASGWRALGYAGLAAGSTAFVLLS